MAHFGTSRHVVGNQAGGWDVKTPGSDRATIHARTQSEAVARERAVGRAGGGQVRIHGRDGRIRDSDTAAPGNDPGAFRDAR